MGPKIRGGDILGNAAPTASRPPNFGPFLAHFWPLPAPNLHQISVGQMSRPEEIPVWKFPLTHERPILRTKLSFAYRWRKLAGMEFNFVDLNSPASTPPLRMHDASPPLAAANCALRVTEWHFALKASSSDILRRHGRVPAPQFWPILGPFLATPRPIAARTISAHPCGQISCSFACAAHFVYDAIVCRLALCRCGPIFPGLPAVLRLGRFFPPDVSSNSHIAPRVSV